MMSGRVAFLLGLRAALALAIAAPVSVSAWAAEKRIVSPESGSAYPGKWRNERVPYLVEVMDCLGYDRLHRTVVVKKSAQMGFSEVGVNLLGYTIDVSPRPAVVICPSDGEVIKYNAFKLDPTIRETPELSAKVREVVSRDESSSTLTRKHFPGGSILLVGASSSKGLQAISAGCLIFEEPTEYPADVNGRGPPVEQARSRAKGWSRRGYKEYLNSTPGLKGACLISAAFEEGDQRRLYAPCPHCGAFQVLDWPQMAWRSDRRPYGAYLTCRAAGCVIEARHQDGMIAAARWVPSWADRDGSAPPKILTAVEVDAWRARDPQGREPSFAAWQVLSPFVAWEDTVHEFHEAQKRPGGMKTFVQQCLGEAFEEEGDAPDVDRLLERREKWPARRIPPAVLFLTGATDVQGDRLEWAVYGWDRNFGAWLVEAGVIPGDPTGDDVWLRHDEVLARRWTDAWGKAWPVDLWGVDAGFQGQQVYRYARRHAESGKVRALDGRPGWRLPAIGTPKTVDIDYQGRKIGAVQLWPVGTWDLKSETYAALRLTLRGPDQDGVWPRGAMHFSEAADQAFFEQLTAEALADFQSRAGYTEKRWVKLRGRPRNEQHDLAVYNRALARTLADGLSDADWDALKTRRHGVEADVQMDFRQLWTSAAATPLPVQGPAPVETAEKPAETAPPPPARSAFWSEGRSYWR